MSNKGLIIPERARNIGKFTVGRLIPFRKKRQVGPFVFIDHMGPKEFTPNENMDVDQHHHIGLCTLTYLIEGAVEYTDSTGANQVIEAGDVGLMSAGSGVTHTERTPKVLRNANYRMHGYQIWIALPKALEEMEPRFDFLSKKDVPIWSEYGMDFKLIAGEGFGKNSPLPVHSNLFLVEVKTNKSGALNLKNHLVGELGVVVSGTVSCGEEPIEKGNMIVTERATNAEFQLSADAHLLLFGGEVFPEERFLFWNFCSHSKDRLEQAKMDWKTKRFPEIEGDETYIPLP